MITDIKFIKGRYLNYNYIKNNNLLIIYNTKITSGTATFEDNAIKVSIGQIKFIIIDNKIIKNESKIVISNEVTVETIELDKQNIKDIRLEKVSDLRYGVIGVVVIVVTKWLSGKFFTDFFVNNTIRAIKYIKYQPIGIKQNTEIQRLLGNILLGLTYMQYFIYKHLYCVSVLLGIDSIFNKLSVSFVFLLYKYLVSSIIDLLLLFRNRSYNKLKKRYDTVKLSIDQIIMSVLLFSIILFIFMNIVCYYVYYLIFYSVYNTMFICEWSLKVILMNTDKYYYYDLDANIHKQVTFKRKVDFVLHEIKQFVNANIKLKNILTGKLKVL